jgi:hypothetical protein
MSILWDNEEYYNGTRRDDIPPGSLFFVTEMVGEEKEKWHTE